MNIFFWETDNSIYWLPLSYKQTMSERLTTQSENQQNIKPTGLW